MFWWRARLKYSDPVAVGKDQAPERVFSEARAKARARSKATRKSPGIVQCESSYPLTVHKEVYNRSEDLAED